MGMIKKDSTAVRTELVPAANGVDAALARLSESKAKADPKPAYKPRDFDKEARGKVRFGMYAAALQSPAVAGMKWDGEEALIKIIRRIADDGTNYSFED